MPTSPIDLVWRRRQVNKYPLIRLRPNPRYQLPISWLVSELFYDELTFNYLIYIGVGKFPIYYDQPLITKILIVELSLVLNLPVQAL